MTALFRLTLALTLSFALCVRPALAQSILRDAETEQFLQDISAPMVKSAGMTPNGLKLMLIGDKEINAFVAQGQTIYLNSGTIEHADNAGEIEGVIAHELGHIEAGGAALSGAAGAKLAGHISILSLLVAAAAIAAGAGEAGMAAMMAGQSAAQGKYLAFTRQIEGSADASAVRHLNDAHYSGKGMVSFFGKLRREEYRLTPSYTTLDSYEADHPMTDDRILALRGDLEKSPYWDKPDSAADQQRFLRIKAKLIGFLDDPDQVLKKYPETDQSVPAMYARAYAWHRGGYPDRAVTEVDKLIRADPHDPYFLELKGQVLLESGKPKEAIVPLREAVRIDPNPLISVTLGHALSATEDPANYDEARRVLTVCTQRDAENPFAWYALGMVYERLGDSPRAALATAERYSLEGRNALAMGSAEFAARTLPAGTPDAIRAQDLAMTARVARDEKNR